MCISLLVWLPLRPLDADGSFCHTSRLFANGFSGDMFLAPESANKL